MVTEGFYEEIHNRLWRAEQLEKRASDDPSDEHLLEKTSHDVQTWERIKQAIDFGSVGKALGGAGKAVGKGMLYGAAPAATAVGVGALVAPSIIDHAAKTKEDATKRVIEDVRNKALQTALGVGAIGAGLTGLHHVLATRRADAAKKPPTPDYASYQGLTPNYSNYYKQGSAAEDDLLEKLAAVGYLDTMLSAVADTTKVGKEASLCRLLNAEHGVHILRQLLRQ